MSKEINMAYLEDHLGAMPPPPKYQSTENLSESQIMNPPSYSGGLVENSSLMNNAKADSDLVEIKIEADDANQAPDSSSKGCCGSCCPSLGGSNKRVKRNNNNDIAPERRDDGADATIICCISYENDNEDDSICDGSLCDPIIDCFASIFGGIADCCSDLVGTVAECASSTASCIGEIFEFCGQCIECSVDCLGRLEDDTLEMIDFGD